MLRRDTVLDVTLEAIREAMRTWWSGDLAQNMLFRRQTAIRTFLHGDAAAAVLDGEPCDLLDAIPQTECLPRPFEREYADRIWALELPAMEDLAPARCSSSPACA